MPYQEKYKAGTEVQIASRENLEAFRRDWTFHHPLEAGQLAFAGTTDTVKSVGFYHGGDVIYTLERASGVWHEQLLSPHDGVGDGGISREGE
jgi:hypothetical protein